MQDFRLDEIEAVFHSIKNKIICTSCKSKGYRLTYIPEDYIFHFIDGIHL